MLTQKKNICEKRKCYHRKHIREKKKICLLIEKSFDEAATLIKSPAIYLNFVMWPHSLAATILGNALTRKSVIRAGEGVTKAGLNV